MRKRHVWSMTAILGLGLTAHVAVAAGDEEPKKPSRSLWGRLFAPPIDTIEETQEAINKKKKVEEEPHDNSMEKEAERLNSVQKAREDYLRREKVLVRLMQLASESGDQELSKRIESLNDRAWNVFLKKTGKSPAVGNAREKSVAALSDRGEKP